MKYNYLFIFYFLFTIHFINAQNTVGIINNTDAAYHGYTLFAPNNSTHTYLINNCGELVNKWTSTGTPAASVYLLENGNLLRTGKVANTEITFGGVGGKLELFDWDNNLLWSYNYSSNLISQHHDVYPLPNGNILMLAVTTMTAAEAITEGRDPSLLTDSKLFNEQILELEPVGANGANIVWEWNIKDHLIQDFDVTKNNFGVVTDHPELLNVNFLNGDSPVANWLHINSIQYNSSLDQIILSSRKMSEIYIIDHSTTIAESGSHSGGTYGKGGDFLFRWGNTIAYNKGTALDQKLFGQHFPHWIDDSFIDGGKIIVFNNGLARAYSSVD
ncbi:aryl-sulfate sulfotransferase, partial [Aurantibacter sp.]|uniref:aryl-sulfate sulfotransferase n=1 Tax=Aurantibacter sp. TaxID=2807103 RepID=UPI0035C819D9